MLEAQSSVKCWLSGVTLRAGISKRSEVMEHCSGGVKVVLWGLGVSCHSCELSEESSPG